MCPGIHRGRLADFATGVGHDINNAAPANRAASDERTGWLPSTPLAAPKRSIADRNRWPPRAILVDLSGANIQLPVEVGALGARGCARPGQDDPRNYAASEILDGYLDANFAAISYRDGDSISIAEPDRLAAQLNLPLEQLTAYLESFPEDGDESESSRS